MICKTYEQFFKTLADRAKLSLISELREGKKSVSRLCEATAYEQSRVSHHLRALKESGFVKSQREGKQIIYALDQTTILPLLKMIDRHVDTYYKHYCRCVGDAKRKRWEKRA